MLLLVQKKYILLIFLKNTKTVGLRLNKFQNNITIEIKKALMTEWFVFNCMYLI